MLLATRMIHGMAREIAERVSYLRNECPYPCQPAKRVALRCFAELVLGSIDKLIAGKLKDGKSLHECSDTEKEFVKRLKLCRRDICRLLNSVDCGIDD
ncbi:hypothetical protein IM254_002374 [Escherichia coli]|nr:hypothetical protein [Escherichia coli]EEV7379318.1 hypothetical protein [Escherichia coli]EEZ0286095.1 hypothetical protein [Escherichia coli]EFA4724417.1 hypothetical protein [Escherichia coli]EFB2546048.1 hypothetical protein [Escherichia coli]